MRLRPLDSSSSASSGSSLADESSGHSAHSLEDAAHGIIECISKRFEGFAGVPTDRLLNILVVDDVAVNRKVVCRVLRGEGVVCFEAGDGQDCVDYMKRCTNGIQENVDVILMDYEMPRMNGPTATSVLRSIGCTVPVIGVTGNALTEDKQFFLDNGAMSVICKPVDMKELHSALLKLNFTPDVLCKKRIDEKALREQVMSNSQSQSKNGNFDFNNIDGGGGGGGGGDKTL